MDGMGEYGDEDHHQQQHYGGRRHRDMMGSDDDNDMHGNSYGEEGGSPMYGDVSLNKDC